MTVLALIKLMLWYYFNLMEIFPLGAGRVIKIEPFLATMSRIFIAPILHPLVWLWNKTHEGYWMSCQGFTKRTFNSAWEWKKVFNKFNYSISIWELYQKFWGKFKQLVPRFSCSQRWKIHMIRLGTQFVDTPLEHLIWNWFINQHSECFT